MRSLERKKLPLACFFGLKIGGKTFKNSVEDIVEIEYPYVELFVSRALQ